MSEGLTDQGPYTRGSCNVMMGVEDTCFGPLKKGPKRCPQIGHFGVPNPGSHDGHGQSGPPDIKI